MTSTIIRSSKDLVRQTRLELGLSMRSFGARIGVRGQWVQQVESGAYHFDTDRIGKGLTHPDADIRRFWLDYWGLRQREQQETIIENCIGSTTVA